MRESSRLPLSDYLRAELAKITISNNRDFLGDPETFLKAERHNQEFNPGLSKKPLQQSSISPNPAKKSILKNPQKGSLNLELTGQHAKLSLMVDRKSPDSSDLETFKREYKENYLEQSQLLTKNIKNVFSRKGANSSSYINRFELSENKAEDFGQYNLCSSYSNDLEEFSGRDFSLGAF